MTSSPPILEVSLETSIPTRVARRRSSERRSPGVAAIVVAGGNRSQPSKATTRVERRRLLDRAPVRAVGLDGADGHPDLQAVLDGGRLDQGGHGAGARTAGRASC